MGKCRLSGKLPYSELEALVAVCRDVLSYRPHPWNSPVPSPPSSQLTYLESLEQQAYLVKLFLSLVLDFTAACPELEVAHPRHRGVVTPLTTPALAYTLWARVRYLTHLRIKSDVEMSCEEESRGVLSSESQTEVSCLAPCETCQLSRSMVRDLVLRMEQITSGSEDSSVFTTRRLMKTKVYETTEWGAMRSWCRAVCQDVEQIASRSVLSVDSGRSREGEMRSRGRPSAACRRLRTIRGKLGKKLIKSNSLGEMCTQSTMRCDVESGEQLTIKLEKKPAECNKMEETIGNYEMSIKQLEEVEFHLKSKTKRDEETMRELVRRLSDKEILIQELEEKIKMQEDNSQPSMIKLEAEIESGKEKIDKLNNKLSMVEEELRKSRDEAATVKKEWRDEVATIQLALEEATTQLDRQHSQIKQKNEKIDWYENKIKELETQLSRPFKENESLLEKLGVAPQNISLTGDPMVDMERQRRANEEQIKVLQETNKKLESTLSKLYVHKVGKKGNQHK